MKNPLYFLWSQIVVLNFLQFLNFLFFRTVTVKDLEKEMEYGKSRKLYDRPEFLTPAEATNSTQKSDLENKVALPRGRGLTNVLNEKLISVPSRKSRAKNFRINGSFIAGIWQKVTSTAQPTLEVNEEVLLAKEQLYFRALAECGFREITESGTSCVARTRGCYKWKIAMRASTSYEVVLVLDENQVRLD